MFSGYFFKKNYMAMPHHFFRRGHGKCNNYAPKLIDMLWGLNDPKLELSIAVDLDRVRVNVDKSIYLEADTWYGAPFSKSVQSISDNISKLRPPLDLDDTIISFMFNDAYALDVKWDTKDGAKSFQSEEFKSESIVIESGGQSFHPVRYIHAEYDLSKGCFRHLDGAIHLYTDEEYFERRDSDFNFNNKGSAQIKSKSIKLFKMNGCIEVDDWVEYCSHFCTGNPLIYEYFNGAYPDHTSEMIKRIRSRKSDAKK
jgi:hypothetical protein